MKRIVDFQIAHGLAPDGIIGPLTLNAIGDKYGLSPIATANFMGQLHHESAGFTKEIESLNYSVSGLKETFLYYRQRPLEAEQDGRTLLRKAAQETIANKVYWDENRSSAYKLGNFNYGDGWKYRGRGPLQITGRYNYEELGQMMGVDLVQVPSKVNSDFYWESAIWFFGKHNLWEVCEELTDGSIAQLTRTINGGANGLDDRKKQTFKYYNILTKNQ